MSASGFLAAALSAASLAVSQRGGPLCRELARGVLELSPRGAHAATPAFVVSAGVHGNETAPVEILAAIVDDVLAGRLPLGVRLLAALGHPDALQSGERYLDYDMNRLFCGRHALQAGAREAARAAELEACVGEFFDTARGARLHYDLHTAIRGSVYERFAIVPYLGGERPARQRLATLAGAGIEAVLLHSAPAATFSYHTSHHHGAESYTLELGKARAFGQNDLARFAAIDAQLRRLVSGEPAREGKIPPCFAAKYDLIKKSEAFRLHLDADVENFTRLAAGSLIAEDGATRYVAAGGDERILFPNPGVKPGLRAGIVIGPVSP
ncbi:succinylglutamate desuccinylase [Crenobacter caeni]|uniref:succinylglutamate desuccinylase n=1 Tax=Crenobacter caeni TaxID=2705474 RepID=UPI0032C49872